MKIIAVRHFDYELHLAAHAMSRAYGKESIRLDGLRVCAWVEVTHETKKEVMKRVSAGDLKAVGCENPDIYVNSRRDDTIVLVRPQSHRNKNGRGKKHITQISAREIFGRDWPDKINAHKFERLGQFHEEVARTTDFSRVLRDEDAFVFFVYDRSIGWVAYLYSRYIP